MNLSLLNIYGPSFINDLLTFSYFPATVSFFLRIENLRKIQESKGKKKGGGETSEVDSKRKGVKGTRD